MKKPEAFPWDDELTNNHGYYDMEEMDVYLAHLNENLDIAVKALKFYADKRDAWFSGGMEGCEGYSGEHGNRAQEALIKITERTEK